MAPYTPASVARVDLLIVGAGPTALGALQRFHELQRSHHIGVSGAAVVMSTRLASLVTCTRSSARTRVGARRLGALDYRQAWIHVGCG